MSDPALASLLPLAVAVPLAGGVLAILLARISGWLAIASAVLSLAGAGAILLLVAPRIYQGHQLTHYLGHWVPAGGAALGIAFSADAWGLTYALAVALIGVLVLLFTLSSQSDLGPRELGSFACLFLLLAAALIGVGLTGDVINLFVWFEVAALASYALTAFFLERPMALEAAFKILVLTNIASFAVFLGASFLYTNHGALNFGQLAAALRSPQTVDLIALSLLVAGFATKAGLVPFHGWLPDAHTAAPGPVSALFSGLMVSLGIVVLGRLAFQIFGPHSSPFLGWLMVIGLVSAVGGALFALFQDDLKRLLAYDTISQMGVLAVGLGSGSLSGLSGAAYHLVNQALFKSLLFLCAGAIVHATGATALSDMGGLVRRFPWLAAGFVVGALAIAGIPPLNGYVSVGLIHDALRESHQTGPLLLMIAAQVLTVAALGKAAWQAFFRARPPSAGDFARDEKLHPGMVAALVILMAGCVAFGILPEAVLAHVAAPAAGALANGARYGGNLLAGGLHPGASLPVPAVTFSYFSGVELAIVAVTLLLAAAVFRWAQTADFDGGVVGAVRSVQTGSVNDYAAYLVVGLVLTVVALALA